jgi:hypothetical protein
VETANEQRKKEADPETERVLGLALEMTRSSLGLTDDFAPEITTRRVIGGFQTEPSVFPLAWVRPVAVEDSTVADRYFSARTGNVVTLRCSLHLRCRDRACALGRLAQANQPHTLQFA